MSSSIWIQMLCLDRTVVKYYFGFFFFFKYIKPFDASQTETQYVGSVRNHYSVIMQGIFF